MLFNIIVIKNIRLADAAILLPDKSILLSYASYIKNIIEFLEILLPDDLEIC